jgi:ribosomal 50S subunit-recycling heat shock protein
LAKFIISKDIALLDKGVGERNRFVAIEDVDVDEYGSLSPQSLQSAKRALSNEAVRKGAVRINQSNCVDMSGGLEASDDMVMAFNGRDIIYTSLQSGFALEKFMIQNELLVPETKLKPRSLFSKWFS